MPPIFERDGAMFDSSAQDFNAIDIAIGQFTAADQSEVANVLKMHLDNAYVS